MPGFKASAFINNTVNNVRAGGYLLKQAVIPHGIGFGTVLTVGLTAWDVASRMKENPKEGLVGAAGRAAFDLLLWKVASPVMWGLSFGQLAYTLGGILGQRAFTYRPTPGVRNGNSIGRGFFDNAAKATARRRAVAAMQESKMAVNFALGSEARRISRGYFDSF